MEFDRFVTAERTGVKQKSTELDNFAERERGTVQVEEKKKPTEEIKLTDEEKSFVVKETEPEKKPEVVEEIKQPDPEPIVKETEPEPETKPLLKLEEKDEDEEEEEQEDFFISTDVFNDIKGMAASKLLNQEKAEVEKRVRDDGIMSIIYSAAKKVAIVGIVYFMGYMNLSVAWLICPLLLSVVRDQVRAKHEIRREVAKASATASDKEVILAKLDDLPAWVFFPDVERCEWLNRVLKQVWPNANHFTRSLIKDSIEPNVQKALAGYKLNGFRFERMILGTIPPRIGGIKVYDKNVSRNEIIMDLDLFYAGNCDISFVLGGMRGGIKDFQIHGTMRVVMKPLINTIPLVGGIQLFFLNNPNIDFNLVGVVDLLDMPGLSDILRRIIVEQVAAMMVLPNKLPIKLSDAVEALSLKMPEPEGVLRVHVVEAKDLMKMDIGVLGKGKSDPYAIVTVGAQQFRTQIIDNNVNPKWDFWCEANVYAESGQTVDFQLYDKDDTGKDEFLGMATVEISNVVKKGELDTWLTLEQAKHGLVHVRLTWFQLSSDKNDLKAVLEETQMLRVTSMSCALLSVFIDSARNLPQARQTSKPDPYLVLSVGKKTEQTAVQMRTDSPVWEQGFTFLVANPDNDTLQLKVIDQKTSNELGKFTYILSHLMEKKNMEILTEPFQMQKSGPETKILMALSLRVLKRGSGFDEDVTDDDKMAALKEEPKETVVDEPQPPKAPLRKHESKMSTSVSGETEPLIAEEIVSVTSASPPSPTSSRGSSDRNFSAVDREPSVNSLTDPGHLGSMMMTLRYNLQRQRLSVIVHRIKNIPLKDPSNIPDPYVKLYLLPGRSKESKRKTNFVKDNCNPVFDATFEYVISSAELHTSSLEITVATQKMIGSPILGMFVVDLNDPEVTSQGVTKWYNLQPEIKAE